MDTNTTLDLKAKQAFIVNNVRKDKENGLMDFTFTLISK